MLSKKRKSLNPFEKKLIRLLYGVKKPKNASRIAKSSKMSYPTAKKYLNNLTKRKILLKKRVTPTRRLRNVNYETVFSFNENSYKKQLARTKTRKVIKKKSSVVRKVKKTPIKRRTRRYHY